MFLGREAPKPYKFIRFLVARLRNQRKTKGKPKENQRKTKAKPKKHLRKTKGKPPFPPPQRGRAFLQGDSFLFVILKKKGLKFQAG